MNTKISVEDFLAQKTLAVVGVSRSGKKFGNTIFKDLKSKGFKIFGVNPNIDENEGEIYKSLESIPDTVEGVIVVVPPAETEKVVKDAADAGIKHVWLQQGAESETAVKFCKDNDINVISGECVLMFAEPTGFPHRLHRGIWRILGKLPK
ncbi:CoA-binding protein [candidate division KSB1 bacterium]